MAAPLKLGVLGAGHLGKIHLKCALATTCWQVSGFYDPDDANAAAAEKQFSVQRFASPEALFEAVDAIDIVTPTPQHYEMAVKAMRAGKHVFIEKPVTATFEQGKKLLAMAQSTGLTVQVGHVERFNPAFEAIRGMALQPMFIEAHRLAAFQPRGTEVSVILDLMIHDLDLILHLVKSPVVKVSASGVAVLSHTPDIANARVEFANGCVVNLTASRMSVKQMRKMRIFQRDAYLSLDFLEKNAQIIRLYAQDDVQLPPVDDLMEIDTPLGKKWLQMQMPETGQVNAIQRELETFAEAIQQKTPPPVTLADGVAALQLAQRILKAIDKRVTAFAS